MSDIELRAMVRDVLRDVLAKGNHGKAAGQIAQARQVALTTDKEVADFVTMLIAMIDDPATGNAVRTGQVKFTVAGNTSAGARPTGHTAQPAVAPATRSPEAGTGTLDGIVTEARINKLAGPGTILLSPDAVITPLARDRARSLGLKLERKR